MVRGRVARFALVQRFSEFRPSSAPSDLALHESEDLPAAGAVEAPIHADRRASNTTDSDDEDDVPSVVVRCQNPESAAKRPPADLRDFAREPDGSGEGGEELPPGATAL